METSFGERPSPLTFFKYTGAGNDFVVIDNREGAVGEAPILARRVCPRRIGVGADGLLLLETSEIADVRMRYLNADGGEVEMCGNGLRCLAHLAVAVGAAAPSLTVETAVGVMEARVGGDRVRVGPFAAERVALRQRLEGVDQPVHLITVGVPHVVMEVTDLEEFPVEEVGRRIRNHPRMAPGGTNADFVWIDQGEVRVRTYERGVEGETLACGTGAMAVAVVAGLLGQVRPPVTVVPRSGEALRVAYEVEDGQVSGISLEGPVRQVYRGELE